MPRRRSRRLANKLVEDQDIEQDDEEELVEEVVKPSTSSEDATISISSVDARPTTSSEGVKSSSCVEDVKPTFCSQEVEPLSSSEDVNACASSEDSKAGTDSEACTSGTSWAVIKSGGNSDDIKQSPNSDLTVNRRSNMNPSMVDSEEEMEASMAETCSTLLDTPRLMVSRQQVLIGAGVGTSGASQADCDRMKAVFQSGLAIHFSGEEMEASQAVSTILFPHQRVALAWMVGHENICTDGMRGGILADDMGLGKSLTVISLVLTNFWDGMPLLKPEIGFVRRPLTMRRKKGKRAQRKMTVVSAEALGVGSKLGGGEAKKTCISGLFDRFRKNNENSEMEDRFKFGDRDRSGRRSKMKYDHGGDEDDNSFIDDSSESDLSCDIEEGESDSDEAESDLEFDPKLNTDGFIDDSDSEEDLQNAKKHIVYKRRLYDSDSEDFEEDLDQRESDASKSSKKLKYSAATKLSNKPATLVRTEGGNESDSDEDSLPDIAQAVVPEVSTLPQNSSIHSHTRRNEETGLKLIIPPRQPAERKGRRRATLLVCPTSLISHWVDQFQEHLDNSVNISLKVYHGITKTSSVNELENCDIVITTYGTMASEWGMNGARPLFKVKWLRVVMDEGHSIKNHNTKSAKAALDLNSLRKWIVTGTPIQNNLMDLWSLVNWLGFGLYAGKPRMRLYKDHIERPCIIGNPRGFERLQVLMDAICLRRTKADKKPDGSLLVELPDKTILTREVVMSKDERLCYAVYHKYAADLLRQYQRRGELLRNYAHVFVLMIRLRQLTCHRELIREVDWDHVVRDREGLAKQLMELPTGSDKELQDKLAKQLREMIKSGVSDDCSICLSSLVNPVITECVHVFCRLCIEQVIDTVKPPACPLCRAVVTKQQLLEAGGQGDEEECIKETDTTLADMEDIVVDVSSSKINAALKEMIRIRRDRPDDKIIVVSQFTRFLSIIQPLLRENNFPTVRLDGSMSHMDRSEAVSVFQATHPNSPKVLLLSLKAGGVGLNLTAANHLLLLDPAWNPACEWQCFDRTHRMGQTKDVTIYKFITKDSIEEQMLLIQAKKEKLITGAFNLPAEEQRKQRVAEIKSIFGI